MATKILNRKGYGLGSPLIDLAPAPIISRRAPGVHDQAELGSIWIDRVLNDVYVLTSVAAGASSWIGCGGGAGAFVTVNATTSVTTPRVFATTLVETPAVTSTGALTLTAAAAGAMTFTASGIFDVNATGAATIDAASFSIDSTTASNVTVTGVGQDLTLSSVGGSVDIVASEDLATAVSITASGAASGVTMTTGTAGLLVNAPFIQLGANKIYFGAGDPAAALGIALGDLYIRTDPTGANDRMWICTVALTTWVHIAASA